MILVEWWEIPFFGGPKYIDAQETVTDKNGMFTIKGIWVLNPMKHMGADAIMTIFKSGYQFHNWPFHNWSENRPEVDASILNIENGITVIMLKQLTMGERERQGSPPFPPTMAPLKKVKMMLMEINKDLVDRKGDIIDIWRGENVYNKNIN